MRTPIAAMVYCEKRLMQFGYTQSEAKLMLHEFEAQNMGCQGGIPEAILWVDRFCGVN